MTHELVIRHDLPESDEPCFDNLWVGTCTGCKWKRVSMFRVYVEKAYDEQHFGREED